MVSTAGWVAPGWEGVKRAFDDNFERGKEVGAAFAAYHRGDKVVDLWGGVADESADRPWQEDTMVLVYSTTKGVTAMCANRLADEGALDVEAPVCEYWPEFAQSGKQDTSVADLLAHRAGLAWVDGTMSFEEMLAWEPVTRALELQAPAWPPGSQHGYHATTYGWLVGEVVRRITGRSLGSYLRDEIAGPIAADFFIGLPGEEEQRVAKLVPFSLSLTSGSGGASDPGGLMEQYLGSDGPLSKALNAPGGVFRDATVWDSPRLHAAEIPAANGICDARSLALLYASCMGEVVGPSGEKVRTFSEKQLERALRQETEGPDVVLLGLDIQWGLGFILNRGITAASGIGGPRSFGHFGMGGSAGWADPDSELAMGYVMNRLTLGLTGDSRSFKLMQACFEAARA